MAGFSSVSLFFDMEDNFMDLLTLLTLAVGLSMDAFAVSICKGLAMREKVLGKGVIIGLWFGGFQALMPIIGFFLGTQFKDQITSIDHWIAFILLGLIGINMVKESLSDEEENADASIEIKEMFMLAVATSIDALAGITFAFLNVHIVSGSIYDRSLYIFDFIFRSKDWKYFWNKI